jgi:hypothetical protein
LAGGTVSARTRIEERFIEGYGDMGVRMRQQVRYVHPLAGKLSAFGIAEFFFNLNDTDWGAHSGFDRWRIGGGLRHPVAGSLPSSSATSISAPPGAVRRTSATISSPPPSPSASERPAADSLSPLGTLTRCR